MARLRTLTYFVAATLDGVITAPGRKPAAALITEIDELAINGARSPSAPASASVRGAHAPQQCTLTDARTIDIGVTFASYRRVG